MPTSSRKKPHCRTCLKPMAGHKREAGVPVCGLRTPPASRNSSPRSSSSLSPSPSASLTPTEIQPHPPVIARRGPSIVAPRPQNAAMAAPILFNELGSVEHLGDGHFRRQNPHWQSPPSPKVGNQQFVYAESVVDTERASPFPERVDARFCGRDLSRVTEESRSNAYYQNETRPTTPFSDDENENVPPFQSRDPSSSPSASSSSSSLSSASFLSKPLISIFQVPRGERDAVRYAAEKRGLFVRSLLAPLEPGQRNNIERLESDEAWWTVVGHEQHAVDYIVQMQSKLMGELGLIVKEDRGNQVFRWAVPCTVAGVAVLVVVVVAGRYVF